MIAKLQNLLGLVCLGLLSWTFTSCESILGIRGEGDVVTEIRSVKNFHALDISTSGEVEMRVDSVYRVEVSCEESIIMFLETLEDDGVLKIHFDRDVYDVDHLKIVVYAPKWDGIEISGSAHVDAPDPIAGNTLDLGISGSGKVNVFKANFHRVVAKITGSGNVALDGSADDLDASITGSGDLDALDCPVKTATLHISGSGNARVNVSETLNVTISGSGDVEYQGTPKVSSSVSGSGKVRKI